VSTEFKSAFKGHFKDFKVMRIDRQIERPDRVPPFTGDVLIDFDAVGSGRP
jgi:hypothetical protein